MRSLLDAAIVFLMVAILLTLSLPVCVAVVEQAARMRSTHADRKSAGPNDGDATMESKASTNQR